MDTSLQRTLFLETDEITCIFASKNTKEIDERAPVKNKIRFLIKNTTSIHNYY